MRYMKLRALVVVVDVCLYVATWCQRWAKAAETVSGWAMHKAETVE